MSHPVPQRPGERVFAARPQLVLYLTFLIGSAGVIGVALELGLGTRIRTALNATPDAARDIALMLGGAAGLLFVFAIWCWYADLRWVSLSRDGLRWWKNGSVHFRPWHDVERVEHCAFELRVNGHRDDHPPARWVEVHFRSGAHLHLSDTVVEDYEALVAAIKLNSPNRLMGFIG